MMKKISIVLVISHGKNDIEAIVKSLRAQSERDWELVIVAKDSYDYKKHLMGCELDDERILQYFTKGSDGYAYAFGIEQSSAAYITLMTQNQRYYSMRLESMLSVDSHVAVDNYIVIDSSKEAKDRTRATEGLPRDVFGDVLLAKDYNSAIYEPSLLFGRSLSEHVGFDELIANGRGEFQKLLLKENEGGVILRKF